MTASSMRAGVGGGPFVSGALRESVDNESITDIVRLANGNLAVCGTTGPVEPWGGATGGYATLHAGGNDAFVAIMSPTLDTVKAFTFFGGQADDEATSITVDGNGTIIIVGTTTSASLPTTTGAFSPLYSNQIDGYVFGFSPDLSKVRFGSYINGNKDELPVDVEVDALSTIYICGSTSSPSGFPTTNGFDRTHDGGYDAFLMRLSENAGSMLFSTYFGGESNDVFNDLAVDPSGTVALAGTTNSANFPTYPTVDPRWWWYSKDRPYDWTYNGGNSDGVLTIFSADGARAIVSTFVGGTGDDEGAAVVLGSDDVTIIGNTTSTDLSTTGGQQAIPHGGTDVFLTRFNPTARTLLGSTYFGGSSNDVAKGAARHAKGEIAVWGTTTSMDFPKNGQTSRGDFAGGRDVFLSVMGVGSTSISTLFGGSADDIPLNAVMEPDGGIVFAGISSSSQLVLDGPVLRNNGPAGSIDGMIVRFENGAVDLATPVGGERYCVGQKVNVTWTLTEMTSDDQYIVEWSTDGNVWSVVGGPVKTRAYPWTPAASFAGMSGYVRVRSLRYHASASERKISIDPALTINSQPEPTNIVCPDGTRTLKVVTNAPDARYQWRRNGVPIPGATLDSLVLRGDVPNVAGQYDVVATAVCGQAATSTLASVSVGQLTVILEHPSDTTVKVGTTLTLTVQAQATNIAYQWLHNGTELPGQTSATLRITSTTAADAGSYSCRISGYCGITESDAAVVTISGISSVADAGTPAVVIYPNPASSHATVRSDRPVAQIQILDLLGRPLTSFEVESPSDQVSFTVKGLPAGQYFVRIRHADNTALIRNLLLQ